VRQTAIAISILIAIFILCKSDGLAQQQSTIWAVDFVKTKQGQLDDYLKFNEVNWVKAREEMKKQGTILSYKVLTLPQDSGGEWNVLLMTEYADMKMYEAREKSYQSAVAKIRPAGQGATLINGKSARQMADIIFSKLFTSLTSSK
jgi:hypothetical protein